MKKHSAVKIHKERTRTASADEAKFEAMPSEKEVAETLRTIYEDQDGNVPDLKHFEHHRSRWWLYALGAAAVFATVVVVGIWAGIAWLKPFRGFSGNGLGLRIEGPSDVTLGASTIYDVVYENRTSDPIASAEVHLNFPLGFTVDDVSAPEIKDTMIWRLGSIPVSGNGTLRVRGRFVGTLGETTAIQLVGTYRPASFNSNFETIENKIVTYAHTVLTSGLSLPAKILPGDRVTFNYQLENTNEDALRNLEVRVTLPEGFERDTASASGTFDGRIFRLPLGVLDAHASTTARVTGTFAAGTAGEVLVRADVGQISPLGDFVILGRTQATSTVLAGDLSLKLVVNGKDEDVVASYGSLLHFAFNYENTSPEELKEVKLRLLASPMSSTTRASALDWKTFEDSASGTRKGDTVEWTKQQIASLARLSPRQDGVVEGSIYVPSAASGTANLAVRFVVEAEIAQVGSTDVRRVVRTAPIIVRYLTDATCSVEARYFSEEGAPLGSGPLPPVSGQATTYRVRWSINKRFHDLRDIRVSAPLSSITQWTGKSIVEAGNVMYVTSTRQMMWTLNRLPEQVSESSAEFDVTVTPQDPDVGRFAELMGEAKCEMTDATVGTPLTQMRPRITSDLQNDEAAKSKGVVRKL